jgi:hypothetical protein
MNMQREVSGLEFLAWLGALVAGLGALVMAAV